MRRGRWRVAALVVAVLNMVAVGGAGAQLAPTLVLQPGVAEVGSTVQAAGEGFAPGGTVVLFLDRVGGARLGSATPGRGATFAVEFTVPAVAAGNHTVIACGGFVVADLDCGQRAASKLIVSPADTSTTRPIPTVPPIVIDPTTTTTRPTTTTAGSVVAPTTSTSTATTAPGGVGVVTTTTPTTAADAFSDPTTTLGGDPGSSTTLALPDLAISTTTTQLDEASPSDISDIELHALEVTQGLQNLDNEFPLLADRITHLRVHAFTHSPGGTQAGVTAAVLGIRDGVELGIEFAQNAPVTLGGSFDGGNRRTNNGTPYIALPASWTADPGELTLRVIVFANGDVDASNEADADNNEAQVTVTLHESRPITLHYWPVYFEDDAGAPLVHEAGDGFLAEHLTTYRIWPVAALQSQAHTTVVGDESSDFDLSEGGSYAGPNLALAELYQASGLGDDHIYVGMVHPDVDVHFDGFASAGTTWAQMGLGWQGWRNISGEIIAHEAGHFAGINHAPCAYSPDEIVPLEAHGGAYDGLFPASYSWPNCSLAPTDSSGYYGFDPLPALSGSANPAIMSNDPTASNKAYPWMGYWSPRWTDPWHGCLVLEFVEVTCEQEGLVPIDPDAPNGGHVPTGSAGGVPRFTCDLGLPGDELDLCDLNVGPTGDPLESPGRDGGDLLVSGLIDLDAGRFELIRALHLPEQGRLDGHLHGDPALGGPYVVALVDAEGAATWATTVDIDDPAAHGATDGDGRTWFQVRLPDLDTTQSIVLVRPGEVLASLTPSASAPTVEIVDVTVDESMTVELALADADGDPLVSSVHYRPHDAAAWVPLVASSASTTHVVGDLHDLPGSDDGAIRVLVSDGFHTTIAERRGVVVPDPAPMVTVTSPIDGQTVAAGRWVTLRAAVTDGGTATDEWLAAGGRVEWSSDRDGDLGEGEILSRDDLSEGRHRILAVAVDPEGNRAAGSVTLTVGPSDLPDEAVREAVRVRLGGSGDSVSDQAAARADDEDLAPIGDGRGWIVPLGAGTALLLAAAGTGLVLIRRRS